MLYFALSVIFQPIQNYQINVSNRIKMFHNARMSEVIEEHNNWYSVVYDYEDSGDPFKRITCS